MRQIGPKRADVPLLFVFPGPIMTVIKDDGDNNEKYMLKQAKNYSSLRRIEKYKKGGKIFLMLVKRKLKWYKTRLKIILILEE